jgi:pimeloyl-ACP methyl ester carboxylesterase
MLLPGLMCDARIFAAQTKEFGCVAMNGFTTQTSFQDMARHVLEVAPKRMSLLGHSMGARVALEVWRAAPERVERIALFSTGVHGVKPGEADRRHALRDVGRAHGMGALVDQWLPPMVAPQNQTETRMAAFRRMCIEAGLQTFENQIAALLARPEVESLLPSITCPALIGGGELDLWSPPHQPTSMAAAMPQAKLRIFEGAGHMLPGEAPDELNREIAAWLAA